MVKIIFFDIDGTLIPFGSPHLPESTKQSLLKLHELGIKLYIATGKSLARLINMEVMQIPFDGFLTLNGQLCYDKDFNLIFGHPIKTEEMEVLENAFNDSRISFKLIGEFSTYCNFQNEKMKTNLTLTNDAIPDVGLYKGEKIYQISAFVTDNERKVLEKTMDYCEVTSWSPEAIDIISKGGGKMNAIKHILEKENVTKDEIMAFGDGENDVAMLSYASVGVAMGNGSDECKEAADYITTDINDNGIYNALKHFDLID